MRWARNGNRRRWSFRCWINYNLRSWTIAATLEQQRCGSFASNVGVQNEMVVTWTHCWRSRGRLLADLLKLCRLISEKNCLLFVRFDSVRDLSLLWRCLAGLYQGVVRLKWDSEWNLACQPHWLFCKAHQCWEGSVMLMLRWLSGVLGTTEVELSLPLVLT